MSATYEDGLRVAYRFACDMIDPGRKTIPQTAEFYAGVEWAAREMIACINTKIVEYSNGAPVEKVSRP
jgi:hypothetical protein